MHYHSNRVRTRGSKQPFKTTQSITRGVRREAGNGQDIYIYIRRDHMRNPAPISLQHQPNPTGCVSLLTVASSSGEWCDMTCDRNVVPLGGLSPVLSIQLCR